MPNSRMLLYFEKLHSSFLQEDVMIDSHKIGLKICKVLLDLLHRNPMEHTATVLMTHT